MAGPKIRKGDTVVVLTGKDRGSEGMVSRVIPGVGRAQTKVIVEGVNLAKKHQKPTSATMQGGIIDKDMPMPISNVAVLSPKDGKPTRVGFKINDDGTKVRVCKRTGVEL
ncbi:MAG: 50S ribosomal protein L24 [Actinomycetia bacterium]|nr:50S ribosomal protein L24 [Actinomycetes bacterium]MCP3909545.1 50S ribosomal protein L24 [Actinomycetes bacterium]MCP4085409.1 50S ribosomal protein L24 [Actinomycetes bacterium]